MQRVAKHLACDSNSMAMITSAREMLRCALHDVSLISLYPANSCSTLGTPVLAASAT